MSVPIWINGIAYLPAVEHEALAAELAAEKERSSHMVMASTLDAALARVAALEAAMRQARPYVDQAECADAADLEARYAVLSVIDKAFSAETACVECAGSGLTMQPGMPDGEPEGLPCPKCKSKQFAPIGNGTICSNCTKTIGYHYQTAAGVLWCKVPTSDRGAAK
jgi:hypothetical protein